MGLARVGLVKVLGATGVSALLLTACSGEKKSDEMAVATPQVQPLAVNCDDASIKNRLVREVQMVIDEHAIAQIKEFKGYEEVGLERRLGQRLTELALDLQSASLVDGETSLCQADLQVLLTADDAKYYADTANQADNDEALKTYLQEHALELTADNRVSMPVRYQVDGMTVKLDSVPNSLQELAYVLTASAYGAANDNVSLDLSARKAPTITPLEPMAPTVTPRADLPKDTDESDDASAKPAGEQSTQKSQSDDSATQKTTPPTPKPTGRGDTPRNNTATKDEPSRSNGEREQPKPSTQRPTRTTEDKPSAERPQAQGPAANKPTPPRQQGPAASNQTQQPKQEQPSQQGPAANRTRNNVPAQDKPQEAQEPKQPEPKPESLRVVESDETY